MFVITGHSLGKTTSTFYLSKSELLQMKASGNWDLQAHTRNGHNMFATSANSSAPFFANKMWLKDKGRLETNDEYRARVQQDLQDAKVTSSLTWVSHQWPGPSRLVTWVKTPPITLAPSKPCWT